MALIETEQIICSAFGVALEVSVPARLSAEARALLPPGAVTIAPDQPVTIAPDQPVTIAPDQPVTIAPHEQVTRVSIEEQSGQLRIISGGQHIGGTEDDELALGMLDAQIRAQVALLAPDHIFVHAGVTAVGGRAIVVPGFTFAGKTTLTHALVQAGAVYYSDEFAVLDADGLVHPYPKPLSIRHRDGSGRTTETAAASLGAEIGREPARVGLVAVTSYRPGATLSPEPLASGAALLALLGHTIPARTRPQQSMAALKAAVQGATAWKSERGEAAETARAIIESLS